MPRSWSKKDERQYQHVKWSERKRGRGESRAEEIAARTVNKRYECARQSQASCCARPALATARRLDRTRSRVCDPAPFTAPHRMPGAPQ